MMMKRQSEVEKLDSQCLKRICKDIVRHSVKYLSEHDAEYSEYLNFRRMFSHRLLSVLCLVSNESCLNRSSTIPFRDCINFVFSPFLEKICIPNSVNFSEEIASAISTNCKKLCHLTLLHQVLTSEFCINFFKVVRNLVVLDLSSSSFKGVKLMRAIRDSLVNLRVLDLRKTNIDDCGLYVLCGHEWHEWPPADFKCSFIKTCEVDCGLQLRYINLLQTSVRNVGVACLLTHIPTLRSIPAEVVLSHVISEISRQRESFEMTLPEFQLRTINCLKNHNELRRCLKACPQLKELSVKYIGHTQPEMDEVLAEAELKNLQCVSFGCTNVDLIFSEKLKCFWRKWGLQIAFLYVYGPLPGGHIVGDLSAVRNVLACCPKLRGLYLINFVIRSLRTDSLGEFPQLPSVRFLVLEMSGSSDLVNKTACRIIRSALNVTHLTLNFVIKEVILFPYLKLLPQLKDLVISKQQVSDNFLSFLQDVNQ